MVRRARRLALSRGLGHADVRHAARGRPAYRGNDDATAREIGRRSGARPARRRAPRLELRKSRQPRRRVRANTRKIHSGDRESDAIDAAGLAQAREGFALLGRDVAQLSDDQLRNLVAELERRFRDEALTSAAQAATIILDGVKT